MKTEIAWCVVDIQSYKVSAEVEADAKSVRLASAFGCSTNCFGLFVDAEMIPRMMGSRLE